MTNKIKVEAVYATAECQHLWLGEVEKGTNARQALLQSDLPSQFPEIDFAHLPIGVFGKKIPDDYVLFEWDRIEVYRPLKIDPKESRRRRALQRK